MTYHWTCPFCARDTTITDPNRDVTETWFSIENAEGPRGLLSMFVVCPNRKCRKFTLVVALREARFDRTTAEWQAGKLLKRWRLIPPSDAKVFQDYVPKAIRADYEEACLIKESSPKASATLARRCLQGMIRDFWRVKKKNLKMEIDAIKGKVDPEIWKAIDAVRKVGNIGAHMEKDVNLIVEVEPQEAAKLIALIELLLREWYVARENRRQLVTEVVDLADAKKKAKAPAVPQAAAGEGESG